MNCTIDLFTELLRRSARDLNDLVNVRKYLERQSDTSASPLPSPEPIAAMNAIVSACAEKYKPDEEHLDIILDTLTFLVDKTEDKDSLNACGFEIGNLALKILTAIEQTDKFQVFLCKLLPPIALLCTHCSNAWLQVARPLLNVFTNKRLDHEYLEQGLKVFKVICQSGDDSEVLNFARQNVQLLRSFSMLARRVGDFLTQMDVVELVFIYVHNDRGLCPGFFSSGNRQVNELVKNLELSEFERDSRALINALNQSMEADRKVFSVCCKSFSFGSVTLSRPPGTDGIWMDVCRDSRRLYVSCADFRPGFSSSNSVILQVPVDQVGGVRCEMGVLSGQQYFSVNIEVDNLGEMYEFVKGHLLSCAVLSDNNSRDSVIHFLRTIEELSSKIPTNHVPSDCKTTQQENKDLTLSDMIPKYNRSKVSCTSPLHLSLGQSTPRMLGIESFYVKSESQTTQRSSQMSCTSPVILTTSKVEKSSASNKILRTYASARESERSRTTGRPEIQDPNLQIHHVSSSVRTSQAITMNDSWSSSISLSQKMCDAAEASISGSPRVTNKALRQENLTIGTKVEAKCQIPVEGVRTTSKIDKDFIDEGERRRRRRYSCQIFEEWTSSSQDFIPTQPYSQGSVPDKLNPRTENNCYVKTVMAEAKPKNNCWLLQNKKKRRHPCENPSLLDANGYSYQRWKMPTTSERSNFWLNKLKETSQKVENEVKDVFAFYDDENESDLFVSSKAKLMKRTRVKRGRTNGNKNGGSSLNMSNRQSSSAKNGKSELPIGTKVKANGNFGEKIRKKGQGERSGRLTDAPVHSHKVVNAGALADAKSKQRCVGEGFFELSTRCLSRVAREAHSGDEGNSEVGRISFEEISEYRRRKKSPMSSTLSLESLIYRREYEDSDKMEEIAESLTLGIGRFLREMRGRACAGLSKYLKFVQKRLEELRNEEEDHGERLERFRKCVEYFAKGCCASDSIERMLEDIDELGEELRDIHEVASEEKTVKKVDNFVRKVNEGLLSSLEKQLNELRINAIESYLSNSSMSSTSNSPIR